MWCTFRTSSKESLLKLYNIIGLPVLLCGCKNWTLLNPHARKIETAEMKCLRSVVGCTLYGHKTNEELKFTNYIQYK